jgi:hypothetical protein
MESQRGFFVYSGEPLNLWQMEKFVGLFADPETRIWAILFAALGVISLVALLSIGTAKIKLLGIELASDDSAAKTSSKFQILKSLSIFGLFISVIALFFMTYWPSPNVSPSATKMAEQNLPALSDSTTKNSVGDTERIAAPVTKPTVSAPRPNAYEEKPIEKKVAKPSKAVEKSHSDWRKITDDVKEVLKAKVPDHRRKVWVYFADPTAETKHFAKEIISYLTSAGYLDVTSGDLWAVESDHAPYLKSGNIAFSNLVQSKADIGTDNYEYQVIVYNKDY